MLCTVRARRLTPPARTPAVDPGHRVSQRAPAPISRLRKRLYSERERESERKSESESERARESERECVCVTPCKRLYTVY